MPVIRIDDEVMNELKKRAIELGLVFEPPNSTLRKVFNLDEQILSEEKTEFSTVEVGGEEASEEVETKEVNQVIGISQQTNSQSAGYLQFIKNKRSPMKRLLAPGIRARYIQGGNVVFSSNSPTELARKLKIRPAKYVLTGHSWDNVTLGTEGYRTTVHSFTANGYEVDIGDGWGQYMKEEIKPYRKFDARKKGQN